MDIPCRNLRRLPEKDDAHVRDGDEIRIEEYKCIDVDSTSLRLAFRV